MPAISRVLACGILVGALSGCAVLDVSAWFKRDIQDQTTALAPTGQGSGPKTAPSGWIMDAVSRCATSNPQPTEGESIRWYGGCRDGKIDGQGTLVWNRDGREVERNEGGFRAGELHGEVVTTFADGSFIVGKYVDGQREGNFMIRRPDGSHVHAIYEGGALSARRLADRAEVDAWMLQRAKQVASAAGTAADETPLPQVTPTPAAAPVSKARTPVQPAVAAVRYETPKRSKAANTGTSGTGSVSQPAAIAKAVETPSVTTLNRGPSTSAPAIIQAAFQPTYYPQPISRLDTVTQTAGMYAGRSGPWVVDSRAGLPAASVIVSDINVVPDVNAGSDVSVQMAALDRAIAAPPSHAQPRSIVPAAFQSAIRSPRALVTGGSAVETAMTYAGRDGPWIIDSRGSAVTPVSTRQTVVSSTAPTPDSLFSQGYRLELAGRWQAAAQVYDALLLQYPSEPSALLANARLVRLRQPQPNPTQLAQVQGAEAPGQATRRVVRATGDAAVVTVNSPIPSGSMRPASLTPAQAELSPALHRQVCSRDGLYESNSSWCGTVTSEQGAYFWVRVDQVHLGGFATIGITRSACTGNNFLTWFSPGSSVRVPKECMKFKVG